MPTDTEQRVKELLVELGERGVNIIKLDGEALEKVLRELIQKNSKLEKDNAELIQKIAKLEKQDKGITEEEFLRRMGGKENFDDKGVYKGGTSTSNNQQPTPNPQPSKPDEKPQPQDP